MLLFNGTVAGIWHYRRTVRKLHITVEPFTTLTVAQRRELDDQATRIREILEGEAQLTIGLVTMGGHA